MAAVSEEQQQIRQLAREFAQSELRSHTEEWDRERLLPREVVSHLAELGFFGMLLPEDRGGMGFDAPTYVAALEQLAWGEAGVALTVAASSFVARVLHSHGSEAQKTRWLEAMATGEALGCYALAEEDAGSDLAAIGTRATRDGDGWVIDGSKRWVTNARSARVALVVARTDAARTDGSGNGRPPASLFLVPLDASGCEIGARETTMGLRPLDIASLQLKRVRVDADALLGQPGRAAEQISEAQTFGLLGVAAVSIGIAQAALDHALAYAGEREQFGQKIREFEGIQFKLADMATRIEAGRALLDTAAAAPTTQSASMAKLYASEAAMWVTTQAVQIFGGYGYMRDYPVEKLMRDAKAMELLEAPNDVLRVAIARELYRT